MPTPKKKETYSQAIERLETIMSWKSMRLLKKKRKRMKLLRFVVTN